MATNEPNDREDHKIDAAEEDEDIGAQLAPVVRLEEIHVINGEEDEDAILDLFDKDRNKWKERGSGTVKLLKHNETGKLRLLIMRQSKTLKICANHLVLPTICVQQHADNDNSCVWHAADFSDGEIKEEVFCIRFKSVDNCKKFMGKVEEVAEPQQLKKEENKAASNAAVLLENLTVEDKKEQVKEAPKVKGKEEEEEKVKKEPENVDLEEESWVLVKTQEILSLVCACLVIV